MAHHGHVPGAPRDTVTRRPPARLPRLSCIWAGWAWASEKAVVERVLSHSPGVRAVEANPVSQTATVAFDSTQTSVAELRRWVEECGYHCAGQSVLPTPVTRRRSPTLWTGMGRPPMRRRPARRSP
jgi:copper chaperone CopZ